MRQTAATTRSRRILCAAVLGTALLAAAVPAASFAKEIGSGGVPPTGGTVACSPVRSLTVKADPKVGETGLASIGVTYEVTVTVTVIDTATGAIAGAQSAFVAAVPKGV